MYTVSQLSKLAGISIRSLHYYDQIGLLRPTRLGGNGYRHYDEQAALKLQQILFYRELDLSLGQIGDLLSQPDFDLITALVSHKKELLARMKRLERLMRTVDTTISHLKGKNAMDAKGLFEGFSEEEQEKYALEAEQIFDPETVRASNRRWKAYSPVEKEKILAEGKTIYRELISAMPQGAGSEDVQALVARWHSNMQYFWSPKDEQLLAIAEGYASDPRFRVNFAKMHPKLAEFMGAAVKVYVEGRKKGVG